MKLEKEPTTEYHTLNVATCITYETQKLIVKGDNTH